MVRPHSGGQLTRLPRNTLIKTGRDASNAKIRSYRAFSCVIQQQSTQVPSTLTGRLRPQNARNIISRSDRLIAAAKFFAYCLSVKHNILSVFIVGALVTVLVAIPVML